MNKFEHVHGTGLEPGGPCTEGSRGQGTNSRKGVPVLCGAVYRVQWAHGSLRVLSEETDTTENITFPQLSWRAVIISDLHLACAIYCKIP